MNIFSIILILLLGILNYIFESFTEKEFENGMQFINLLSRQAHPFVYKLWSFAKNLALLLIIQFFGVDFIGVYFKTYGIDSKALLFDGVVFITGVAAIVTLISVYIKSIDGVRYKLYKNYSYQFRIRIPNTWKKTKAVQNSNAIETFDERISDRVCFVFSEKKSNFHESAILEDYVSFELNAFKSNDSFDVHKIRRIEGYDKTGKTFVYYESDISIFKKKYVAFFSFYENDRYFFQIRIVIPQKYKELNEHEEIICSFEI
jgi:hypothetical protein